MNNSNYPEILPTLIELPSIISIQGLNGKNGTNRNKEQSHHIQARNDFDAVHSWLDCYRSRPATFRTYQKEVERFLLWCIFQRRKALSSLNYDDFKEFFDFLSNPIPKSIWCGPSGGKGNRRGQKNWKPFVSGLSDSTKSTAISIIYSLITYLYDGNYLASDPLKLFKKHNRYQNSKEEQKIKIQERILEKDELIAIIDAIEKLPHKEPHEKSDQERIRFLVAILYFLGLRIHELETHTWSAFRQLQGKWWFFVLGKGGKLGKIPVNDELLEAVVHYRKCLGLDEYPTPDEKIPIITSWKDTRSLTARHMNKLLKKVAEIASLQFQDRKDKQEKLKKFSAHWLRHLSASMQDKVGVSFKHIRANLRHENDETTRRYVHAIDDERHNDMQKLSLQLVE